MQKVLRGGPFTNSITPFTNDTPKLTFQGHPDTYF